MVRRCIELVKHGLVWAGLLLTACDLPPSSQEWMSRCGDPVRMESGVVARWRNRPNVRVSSALVDRGAGESHFFEAAGLPSLSNSSDAPAFLIRAVFVDFAEAARRTGRLEEPGFTVLAIDSDLTAGRNHLTNAFGFVRTNSAAGAQVIYFDNISSERESDEFGVDGALLVSPSGEILEAECLVVATGDEEFEEEQYNECLVRGLGLPHFRWRRDGADTANAIASEAATDCLRNLHGGL